MNRALRLLLILASAFIVIMLVGPFLISIPRLKPTAAQEELADPDSQFVDVDDPRIIYRMTGHGQPTLVLLHRFAASTTVSIIH